MLRASSKRPDILVLESNVSPVCIETEILPAVTVEQEAVSRLGEILRSKKAKGIRTLKKAKGIRTLKSKGDKDIIDTFLGRQKPENGTVTIFPRRAETRKRDGHDFPAAGRGR